MHLNVQSLSIGAGLGLVLGVVLCVACYYRGRSRGEAAAFEQIKWEVIPICRTKEVGGLFWQRVTVQYGYQFQLYLRGVPALKSEETIIDTKELEKIDQQQLLELTREAVKIALKAQLGGLPEIAERLVTKAALAFLERRESDQVPTQERKDQQE